MTTTLEQPTLLFGPEYLKIQTVFKRDERKVIIPGDWSLDEFALLADVPWHWTEKVDGTNIRVHWNGEDITIGGRTDNAQVPTFLLAALKPLYSADLWRSIFPDANDVTLYGEGYGPKIQKGDHYRQDHALVAFDVRVGDWWLSRENILDVAAKLSLDVVPLLGTFTLREAVTAVKTQSIESRWQGARIEGIVGHPAVDLYTRKGERIMAKIKVKDFVDYERRKGAAA